MIKYKLTDRNLCTHNGFQWTVGVPVTTSGEGGLCSAGWLHYYHHPLLAVLLNPTHADIQDPLLWEVETEGKHLDNHRLKGGCTRMTLIRQLPSPVVTTEQRVHFATLCAKQVCADARWNAWADRWLSGEDRTYDAARQAAGAAARAVAATAASVAAVRAAEAAAAAWTAWTAAAAARAAEAATWTAAAGATADKAAPIDLIALAKEACNRLNGGSGGGAES